MIQEIELTLDEKISLNDKVEAFNKCFDIFKNSLSVNQTILSAFTRNEIMSDDINPFMKYLMTQRRISICEMIITSRVLDTLFGNEYDPVNTTLSLLKKVKKLDGKMKAYSESESEIMLKHCIRRIPDDKQEQFFYELCDSGLLEFNNLNLCETFENLIRKFIGQSKINEPEKFLKYVDLYKPGFRGFPLIIMNESIDKESRIKILKSKYKQKDLSSYIKEIEKRATNLSVVDDFIEATVIQNNRVKEKNAGIIAVMKYIFIGDGNSINRNKNEGIVEFANKYKQYFMDPSFVSMFYNNCLNFQVNTYYRNRNFINFLKDVLLEGCTPEEGIVILSNFAKHTDTYESISDLVLKFYLDDKDDDAEFCLKTSIESINNSRNALKNTEKFLSMDCITRILHDKHKRTLAVIETELFNNVCIINNDREVLSKTSSNKVVDISYTADINNFLRRKILLSNDIAGGGLLYNDKIRFSTGEVVDIFGDYLRNVKNLLIDPNISDEALRDFANRYIMIFLDDNHLSLIADNIMNFKNTSDEYIKYTSRYYWGSSSAKKRETAEVLIENIELIKNIAEVILPRLIGKFDEFSQENVDQVIDSLDSAINSTNLLLAF